MTRGKALGLWSAVGVLAMLALGVAVRGGPTAMDDWFQHLKTTPVRWLTVGANPLLDVAVLAVIVAVAAYRRWWRTAVVALAFPLAAYTLAQLLKPLIGRLKGGELAYPSGHATVAVVVWGLVILVAAGASWAVAAAVTVCALGLLGVGSTFHYVTDVIGGALLGFAIVCLAALALKPELTRVNPDAICVTRGR